MPTPKTHLSSAFSDIYKGEFLKKSPVYVGTLKILKNLDGLGNKRVATTLKRRKVDRCPSDACLQKKKDCLFL